MRITPDIAVLSERTCDLYIARDGEGAVLYVGSAFDAIKRIGRHRYQSAWGRAWATIELRSFPNRAIAENFERALIADADPPHNRQKHPAWLCGLLHDLQKIDRSLTLWGMMDRFGSTFEPLRQHNPNLWNHFVSSEQRRARERRMLSFQTRS